MSNSFTLTVKNPEQRFAEGKAAAAKEGVSITGDLENGTISGSTPLGPIKASYTSLSNEQYRIDILEKPMFVPVSMIEAKVREVIG